MCDKSQRKPSTSCSFIRCSGNGICTPNKFPRRPYTHTVEPCALEDNGPHASAHAFHHGSGRAVTVAFRSDACVIAVAQQRALLDRHRRRLCGWFEGIDCHLAGAAMASTVQSQSTQDHRRTATAPLMPRICVYDPLRKIALRGYSRLTRDSAAAAGAVAAAAEPRKQQPRHRGLGAVHWPATGRVRIGSIRRATPSSIFC